jgi:hypothetical protein
MKLFQYIFCSLIFLMNYYVLSLKAKKKNEHKRISKSKLKAEVVSLKETIKEQNDMIKKLKEQLKSKNMKIYYIACPKPNEPKSNETSSFLELKADPMFKSMTFGFPVPRQISYLGLPDAGTYKKLKYCPAGCIVGGQE